MGCQSSRPTPSPQTSPEPKRAQVSSAGTDVTRFRLLIIGKCGCGKTTILSKVCGENMADAPSTTRGNHNIEKEIVFETNDKLVAHDSEGFEAGQCDEVDVVRGFIERRSKAENINDRLHMVWYCIEMNSRPIQHAEKEFFGILWQVPILAIVTKFDTFVQDVLQKLEEKADEEGNDITEEEFVKQATQEAKDRFDMHYRIPLMSLPYPPKAVLALSETHKSTPNDSRLAKLIQETMKALSSGEDANGHQLEVLFASAQTADVSVKLVTSVSLGISDNYVDFSPFGGRERLVDVWNTPWSKVRSPRMFTQLVTGIQHHIDDGPHMIGHPTSPNAQEVKEWHHNLLKCCRCEQLVSDTTLIMEQVFLLKIDNWFTLEKLLRWYTQRSKTLAYVRTELIKEHRSGKHSRIVGMPIHRLAEIVCNRPSEEPNLDLL